MMHEHDTNSRPPQVDRKKNPKPINVTLNLGLIGKYCFDYTVEGELVPIDKVISIDNQTPCGGEE